MNAKKIILFLIALILLTAVIVTAALVMTEIKDEIDITDTAQKVFDEFKTKALNGKIEQLNKKEQKVSDKFSEVEDLCLASAKSIVQDYSRSSVEYQQSIDALMQYYLFPVDEEDIKELIQRVVDIEAGRCGYKLAEKESDPLKAILLCTRVDPEDTVYYNKASNMVNDLLDTSELKEYTYETLSKNKIDTVIEELKAIDKIRDNDNEIKSLLYFAEQYKEEQENTVTYKGPIEVLSTRNLMAFPETVYAPGSKYANSYDSSLITPKEFETILSELYKNDYMLVSLESFTAENLYGFQLPKGKKPFVFIIEDLTYPKANAGSGVCSSIALDENGKLCTLTDSQNAYDNESILILERFICEHPDFTYKGARGCITLTGYSGIFGYDIETAEGAAQAKKIADHLNADGWLFACHSYSYADMHKASLDTLKWDTEKWAELIEPIIGFSYIYVWPYGSHVRSGEKYNYLRSQGYRVFLGQGITPYKAVENDESGIFFDRRALTGYALRNYKEEYSHLFNTEKVLDSVRPKKQEQED